MAAEAPRVTCDDRTAVRAWLEANADSSTGVNIVFRKGAGRTLAYEEIVEEALCVGWVDSTSRTIDESHAMLYLAPRRPRSAWARTNKARIERLTAAGLMRSSGLAVVEAAKASGTWTALDDVENLIEPAELTAALDAAPSAREAWNRFPNSARRAILEWIMQARTPATRAKRIAETVLEAGEGRRANQWPRPGRTTAPGE